MKWTEADIPLQRGKNVVISGANSGLGFHTSLALAGRGARVIMACRNLEKGEEARKKVMAIQPELEPELWEPGSVQAFICAFLCRETAGQITVVPTC